MRILLLSDFHSNERFEQVYEFLKRDRFLDKCKIDSIIVNGNMLGITEMAPGYGHKYNRETFLLDLDKRKIFFYIAPQTTKRFVKAINDEEFEKSRKQLSDLILSFAEERYSWVLSALRKLSKLRHTYFNFGTLESPLHFFVVDELALILGLASGELRDKVEEEELQEIFSRFKQKLEQLSADEHFTYISLKSFEKEDALFIGIPGVANDLENEEDASVQEKLTSDILEEARDKLHGIKAAIICNNVQGITTTDPFKFTPGSESARAFMEQTKQEPFVTVFIQSHRHFMTTHFYKEKNWHFILNNSAVNNGLFNIIEIEGSEVNCWDVDASTGRVIGLQEYDKDKTEYNTPEERLALNYAIPEDIIEERQLKGCEHM